jgi:hypothetical protein
LERSITKVREWDAAIAHHKEGILSLILQATHNSEALLASVPCDYNALDRLWAPLDGHLERADKALYRAWSSTETILSRDSAVTDAQRAIEETKYYEENNELAIACEAGRRHVMARAAQSMIQVAQHPSEVWSVARWVGEWDAFGHWQNMKRAEMRIGRYRHTKDVPMALLHDYRAAAQNYWEMSLTVEAQLVPHLVAHLPKTIDARMKEARRLLRDHWQWRAFEESGIGLG